MHVALQWLCRDSGEGARVDGLVQGTQTMSVFLRILAMRCAHAGCGRPGRVRSASLRTWWVSTAAYCWHHSHRPLRSRVTSSLRAGAGTAGRSSRTAFFCRCSGIPPNLAISGFLPAAR